MPKVCDARGLEVDGYHRLRGLSQILVSRVHVTLVRDCLTTGSANSCISGKIKFFELKFFHSVSRTG